MIFKNQYGWIPEWPKGTDCKSAANCFDGSNPSPPTSLVETTRGRAIRKLVGLITRRLQVQILSPLLCRAHGKLQTCRNDIVQTSGLSDARLSLKRQTVSYQNKCSRMQAFIAFISIIHISHGSLFAQIAQLVEQRTENPRVAGSIPALGTKRSQTLRSLFLFFMLTKNRFSDMVLKSLLNS